MARLGVNIDHIATLRQARGTRYPDPVAAALLVEKAGADQITIHLREDRRHIQDQDLTTLVRVVQTELNLEMALTDEMVKIASTVKPHRVTLVPEKRQELTTEGGLNLFKNQKQLKTGIQTLKGAGMVVSLFIDPDKAQIEEASKLEADAIEIHTGAYAEAGFAGEAGTVLEELRRLEEAVQLGQQKKLQIAAGHGLTLENVSALVRMGGIEEYNIGHSIIARAVFVGIDRAVREMKDLLR